MSNQLTTLPENLCTVIGSLKSFDVSNNYICPPYPDCFEFIGYQNTENCNLSDISSESDSLENIIDNRDIEKGSIFQVANNKLTIELNINGGTDIKDLIQKL